MAQKKPTDLNNKYEQDLQKQRRKDFAYNWTASSRFLFYLVLACLVLFTWGGCYKLYTKRFEKPVVNVPENTLYTPKYK